jgi:hypothetical protein
MMSMSKLLSFDGYVVGDVGQMEQGIAMRAEASMAAGFGSSNTLDRIRCDEGNREWFEIEERRDQKSKVVCFVWERRRGRKVWNIEKGGRAREKPGKLRCLGRRAATCKGKSWGQARPRPGVAPSRCTAFMPREHLNRGRRLWAGMPRRAWAL